MHPLVSVYVAVLFVVLTPGILLRLPKNGKPLTVAVVHGVVFATVLYFTCKPLQKMLDNMGITEPAGMPVPPYTVL